MHFLFFIHSFHSFAIKQNCQRGIKSSETAIRECLTNAKAFMRASVLSGLKWQQLFVKHEFCENAGVAGMVVCAMRYFISPPLSMAVANYLQNGGFTI